MTIEIIDKQFTNSNDIIPSLWSIWIEITDEIDIYLLPTSELGSVAEGDLQAALDARESELWAIAQEKAISPDNVFTLTSEKRIVKSFALVILDELNILRSQASLSTRTIEQLRQAIKIKMSSE